MVVTTVLFLVVVDIVVVNIHHNCDGLTNDQRDPNCHVSVIAMQESLYNGRKRNLINKNILKAKSNLKIFIK